MNAILYLRYFIFKIMNIIKLDFLQYLLSLNSQDFWKFLMGSSLEAINLEKPKQSSALDLLGSYNDDDDELQEESVSNSNYVAELVAPILAFDVEAPDMPAVREEDLAADQKRLDRLKRARMLSEHYSQAIESDQQSKE